MQETIRKAVQRRLPAGKDRSYPLQSLYQCRRHLYVQLSPRERRGRQIRKIPRICGKSSGQSRPGLLQRYYRGCAFLVNTPEVSRLGAVLAADGFDPVTKKQLISAKTSHTVRALIAGCGLYEQTGAYNIAAGIPAKSGSSGVIVAAARKKAGIAVFSPGLDPVGNSVRGLKALSCLSEKLDLRTM